MKFTRTDIFCLSTIIIFLVIEIFISQYKINTEINEIMDKKFLEEMPLAKESVTSQVWQIEIPKISLIANISDGTSQEILDKNVGHFINTSKQQGNVGLASKYLKELKLLKEGDEIIYRHNELEKIYEVEKCRIIKNTECEFLEETEENVLTLITYVENQPEYRRCIQAEEKEV